MISDYKSCFVLADKEIKPIPQVHSEEVMKENVKVDVVVHTDPYCWWYVTALLCKKDIPADWCGSSRVTQWHTKAESSQCLCLSFLFWGGFRIGALCAYAANQNLSSQVKNIRRLVNSNMRDLHTFANDTPMVRVIL